MTRDGYVNGILDSKKLNYMIISLVGIFVLIGMIFYKISFLDFSKYLLFQLIYVYIPGRLIYRALKLEEEDLGRIITSYGLGIILTIVEYLIFYTINTRNMLYFLGPIFSLIECVFVIYDLRLNRRRFSISVANIQLVTIFFAVFFITFIGFTLQNPSPVLIGRNSYPQDLLWTIGNTQALIRNFPPIDSRLSKVAFNYHYFNSIHFAVASYVTKIHTIDMFFQFSQIGKLFLLVFSTFFLGKTYFNHEKKALLFTFIYLFSNSASSILILKSRVEPFFNMNFAHLTYNAFGYEMAISFMFLSITFLLKQLNKDKFDFRYFLCSVFFLFGTTGCKGPLGAMIVSVIFAIIIILFIQHKKVNILIPYIAVLTTVFLTTYLYFIGGNSSSSGGLDFYIGSIVKDTIVGQTITQLCGNGIISKILIALSIPMHFVLFLPFASVPFAIWFYGRLKDIKNTRTLDFLIGGIALCGIIGAYVLTQDGHSEMYFIMAAIPFIELCALNWLFKNYRSLRYYLKSLVKVSLVISISTTIFIVLTLSISAFRQVRTVYTKTQKEGAPFYHVITKYEFEAMDWIRNNTDINSIIAGDRYYYDSGEDDVNARYFYYSVFSERQFYLEGWYYRFRKRNRILNDKIDTMNGFYRGNVKALNKLQEENVSFIVVSRYLNDRFKPYNKKLKLVFENRDVRIYSIN